MKNRSLAAAILGVLLVANVLLAQEAAPPEPVSSLTRVAERPSPPQAPRSRPSIAPTAFPRRTAPKSPTEVRVIDLEYAKAGDMAAMIGDVFRLNVHIDQRLNRLVLTATKEQTESILSVIAEMDVPGSDAATPRDAQGLIYRIFMFEVFLGNPSLKSFSMDLRTTAPVSSQELLDAAADDDLQICDFLQSDDRSLGQETEILIQGKAASNESLKRMLSTFPESRIAELRWDDDETFTDKIETAQRSQLPEQMEKHIGRFLGGNIRTVGYWFGNVSVPGKVDAPIGPWTLQLQLDAASDRMLELDISVVTPAKVLESPFGRGLSHEILSNSIRAKVGKPIIIGYNRESYGTRKMGAMVIIPEADSL
jgi:hypothetical protein